MRLTLFFAVFIASVHLSVPFKIGTHQVVTTLQHDIQQLRPIIKNVINAINSLKSFQSGKNIDVTGELLAFPHAVNVIVNALSEVIGMLRRVVNIIKSGDTHQINGPTIILPNAGIMPYVNILDDLVNNLQKCVLNIELVGNIVANKIDPLLAADSKTLNIPSSDISQIIKIIKNVLNILGQVGDDLGTAAKQSQNPSHNLVITVLNNAATNVANTLKTVKGEGEGLVAKIKNIGNNTNKVDVLLAQLNSVINEFDGVARNIPEYLDTAVSMVSFIDNPLGADLINNL